VAVEQPTYAVDGSLLIAVVTLVLLGVIIAYATTYHQGWEHLQQHGMRVTFGIAAMVAGIAIPHRWYGGRMRWAILALGLGLLVATLVAGRTVKGAERWLELPLMPFPIQPAEIAKFALPLWLAAHFADLEEQREPDRRFVTSVLLPAGVMFAFLVPTMLQRAIGTTFIMAVSALAIFLLAGVSPFYLVLLAGSALALVGGGILAFPHGWERLVGFLRGRPWQQEQSKIAIACGQLWGKWVTGSKQAVYFVPEVGTDFAVAAICEEFGFLGSCGVFGLYGLFLWRGMNISRRTSGYFGRYLSAGITVTIFLYAMVHIGVAVGVLPTTGQPLPFISYGGTAMLANLFAAGVLLNVSRYERRMDEAHGGRGRNRGAHTPGVYPRA
jgi:cell division protein FtsW (lipid II flippase)